MCNTEPPSLRHVCSRDEMRSIRPVCVVTHCAHLHMLFEWVFCSQQKAGWLWEKGPLSICNHDTNVLFCADHAPRRDVGAVCCSVRCGGPGHSATDSVVLKSAISDGAGLIDNAE